MAKLLVVDDEDSIRAVTQRLLEEAGHKVIVARNGQEGLRSFFQERPDLAIIDVRMPEMDGWQLLQRIREVSELPVIMLTALAQESDKVRGLHGGADDYVVKPFGAEELAARVEAALRRVPQPTYRDVYQDKALLVDFSRHEVYVWSKKIRLSATEFKLLSALVRNAGIVLQPGQLLDQVWGQGYGGVDNLRVHIGYLRRRIEENPSDPVLIETVRAFGYRYRPPE